MIDPASDPNMVFIPEWGRYINRWEPYTGPTDKPEVSASTSGNQISPSPLPAMPATSDGPRAAIPSGGGNLPGGTGGKMANYGYDRYGQPAQSQASGGYAAPSSFMAGGSNPNLGSGVPGGFGSGPIGGGSVGSIFTPGPGYGEAAYNPAMGDIASKVGGLNVPTPAGMPRSLYDKYANLLNDPAQISNDPAYQLMLQQALKASQRSLAAGRMSKSGNAAIQAANVATGSTGQYFRQLSDLYGAGAGMEANRYTAESGVQSQGFRDLLSRYQVQGNLTNAAGVNPAGAAATPGVAPGATPTPASVQPSTGFAPAWDRQWDQFAKLQAASNPLIGRVPFNWG